VWFKGLSFACPFISRETELKAWCKIKHCYRWNSINSYIARDKKKEAVSTSAILKVSIVIFPSYTNVGHLYVIQYFDRVKTIDAFIDELVDGTYKVSIE
jgi:methyltransferase-like protein